MTIWKLQERKSKESGNMQKKMMGAIVLEFIWCMVLITIEQLYYYRKVCKFRYTQHVLNLLAHYMFLG